MAVVYDIFIFNGVCDIFIFNGWEMLYYLPNHHCYYKTEISYFIFDTYFFYYFVCYVCNLRTMVKIRMLIPASL